LRSARSVVLVGAAIASVAAVACNAITGLSDYEKVDCVGDCGSGVADATPDTVLDSSPIDVQQDVDAGGPDSNLDVVSDQVEVDAPEDVAPDVPPDVQYDASEVGVVERTLRWARWQMPHQFLSVVPGAGDAGLPRGAELTLDDGPPPYFHDGVTGLDWTVSAGVGMSLGEAVSHCDAQSAGPLLARLPTRIELVTLFEPEVDPSANPVLGSDLKLGAYWSQSDAPLRDAGAVREYWVVDFAQGAVLTRAENQKAYVRCVLYQK
jgi:hypothetical protein